MPRPLARPDPDRRTQNKVLVAASARCWASEAQPFVGSESDDDMPPSKIADILKVRWWGGVGWLVGGMVLISLGIGAQQSIFGAVRLLHVADDQVRQRT